MKRLVFLATILLSTFQLSAQTLTPLELNDKLTSYTDSLFAGGQAWGKQFNEAYKTKEFSTLRAPRERMVRFINASIATITAMKDVNNSKPLRMAMIGFLRFELHMATDAFQPLETLTPSSTDEEFRKRYDNLKALSTFEKDELAKVAAAQEAYAKENGFRVQTEAEAEGTGKG